MALSEKISGFYTSMEDKYFNLLDALDHRGVPVYAYSDFFEDKGIPSFIVTIAIIIAILILLSIAFGASTLASGEITLNITDSATGQGLTNVNLSIIDGQGNYIIQNQVVGDGTILNIAALPVGTKLTLSASKNGYQPTNDEIILGSNRARSDLFFQKEYSAIRGKIRLIDSQTGTRITDAGVIARFDNQEISFFKDSNGNFIGDGVPEGISLILKVSAEGYTNVEDTITFFDDTIKDVTLSPDGSAYAGKATFLISVVNSEANAIDNAKVTIYNSESEVVLLEDFTSQGVVSGPIQTGIPLRVVIEKEGYLKYDSEINGEGITLRKAEERRDFILKQGGEELVVNVVNDFGLAISGATVQIFDLQGNLISKDITANSGVTFNGLNPTSEVIITAYKENYIAARKKILISEESLVNLIIKDALASNSTRLDIFTTDEYANPVNNASIMVYIIKDGNEMPYGFDDLESSIAGYASGIVEKGAAYRIEAENLIRIGTNTTEIREDVVDTKVYIKMEKKPNVKEIILTDIFGNFVEGDARISGIDGTIIFDSNIENGKIYFNSEDREVVELEVFLEDGNIFRTNLNVKGKSSFDVVVYQRGSNELAPSIEFSHIETENGEVTKGITPGAFYYAVFNVSFPIASKEAGVHFRTGLNTNQFADEDNLALFELDMSGAEIVYSYSYTSEPLPGDEALDRSNIGFEGEANKWAEGIIESPSGVYVTKVKIRASDFTTGKVPIEYRAWALVDDEFYRTPSDNTLELLAQSDEKFGLYASTNTQNITMFESLPECNDDLCVTLNFVDAEENYFDTLGFEAIQGEVYGIEAELSSIDGDYLQVSVESSDNNLVFLGTDTGTLGFTNRSSNSGQNTASSTLNITPNSKQKIRFYFRADSTGAKTITFSALGENEIIKDISFNSVVEKELIVELSEDNVLIGRNFTVRVLDSGLLGVTNALVKIVDKSGSVVKSVSGNGTSGFGEGGNYRIENNLEVGLYTVEVSLPKYKTQTVALLITSSTALNLTDDLEVKLLYNEKQKIISAELRNDSDFTINDLSIETSESENFRVSTIMPPSLGSKSTHNLQLTIEYVGEEDSADEIIDLTVRGMIENKFVATAESSVNAIYNRELDSSCISISPTSTTINLVGRAGANDTDVIEVTNNCEQAVFLQSRVRENTRKSYIVVDAEDISLQVGETRNITINANNLVERQFAREQNFSYEIFWDSNYLTKRMNVNVRLINPSIALSYPGQITMFLARSSPNGSAVASQPIFVTNVSNFPVEGIKFSVDKSYGANVSLSVEPNTIADLEAGEALAPTRLLFAESKSNFSEPVNAQILIQGRLGNLNSRAGTRDNYNYDDFLNGNRNLSSYTSYNSNNGYSTGQETLGIINVELHYSGLDCLKAGIVSDNTINLSAEGAQRAIQINLQNTCAEPVRIIGGAAASQSIIVGVPTMVVGVGENLHLPMTILSANPNVKLERHPVTIKAITNISQAPLDSTQINVNIYSGINFSEEFSKSTGNVSVNICGGTQEKARISVPISATGTNCEEGYCDAIQAAKYLSNKIDTAIKKAKSAAYSSQKDTDALACGTQGFCTFGQIGVGQENINLYLKNDNLSIGALREAFEEVTSGTSTGFNGESTDYFIRKEAIGDDFLQFISGTGFRNNIFIDSELEGCGYYRLTINGAFPNSPTGVDFLSPAIAIRVSQKVETKECRESIENLNNFLPIDQGYDIGKENGTWASSVTSQNNLDELGEKIAKDLFGENRFGNGNGNKIVIREAAVSGGLAELCINGGSDKKEIELKVNPFNSEDITKVEAYNAQISKLVTNAVNGNFGNNCLIKTDEDYKCVKLSESAELGGLAVKVNPTTLILASNSKCVDATITSGISENVSFDIIPVGTSDTGVKFKGVRKISILAKDSDEVYYSEEYLGGLKTNYENRDKTVELIANDLAENGFYQKEIRICATAGDFKTSSVSEGAKYTANGSEFTIKVINKESGNGNGVQSEKIRISTGTLHPVDWIITSTLQKERIPKRGIDYPYYFTAMWQGEPTQINLKDVYEEMKKRGMLASAAVISPDGSGTLDNTEFAQNTLSASRKEAMNSYLLTCAGVAGVCNATGGLGGAALGVIFDCGIPFLSMARSEGAAGYKFIQDFYKSPIVQAISEWPIIGELFKATPLEAREAHDYSATSYITEKETALGGTGGAISKYLLNTSTLSKVNAAGTAEIIAEDVAKSYAKNAEQKLLQMGFAPDQAKNIASDYVKDYQTKLRDKLRDGFKQKAGQQGFVKSYATNGKTLDPKVGQKIVSDTLGSTRPDLGEYLKSKNIIEDAINNGTISNITRQLPAYKELYTPDELTETFYKKLGANKITIQETYTTSTGTGGTRTGISPRELEFAVSASDPAALQRQVYSVIDDMVEEISVGKNVSPADITALKNNLKASVRTQITSSTGKGLSADIFDVKQIGKTLTNRINTLNNPTGTYKEFFKLSTTQTDELTKLITAEIDGKLTPKATSVDDILSPVDSVSAKAFKNKMTRIIKSPRFITSIGIGVACGAAANALGLAMYDKTLNQVNTETAKNATDGFDGLIKKGDTIKVLLTKDNDSGAMQAQYFTVTGNAELEKEQNEKLSVNADGKIDGTFLIWDKKLNEKAPEDRPLPLKLMKTDPDDLSAYLYKKLADQKQVDSILEKINDEFTQQIIFNYSNGKKKELTIMLNESSIVPESYIGAIIASDSTIGKLDTEREAKGQSTKIKEKVEALIEKVRASGTVQVTDQMADELFSGKPTDAELFKIVIGEWEYLLNQG